MFLQRRQLLRVGGVSLPRGPTDCPASLPVGPELGLSDSGAVGLCREGTLTARPRCAGVWQHCPQPPCLSVWLCGLLLVLGAGLGALCWAARPLICSQAVLVGPGFGRPMDWPEEGQPCSPGLSEFWAHFDLPREEPRMRPWPLQLAPAVRLSLPLLEGQVRRCPLALLRF